MARYSLSKDLAVSGIGLALAFGGLAMIISSNTINIPSNPTLRWIVVLLLVIFGFVFIILGGYLVHLMVKTRKMSLIAYLKK